MYVCEWDGCDKEGPNRYGEMCLCDEHLSEAIVGGLLRSANEVLVRWADAGLAGGGLGNPVGRALLEAAVDGLREEVVATLRGTGLEV